MIGSHTQRAMVGDPTVPLAAWAQGEKLLVEIVRMEGESRR